ncbi:TIGR01212 family radical SAM protein [Ileibacterium valens]|uniref:TIGR01212 family radical SAM protein n=1 Tax=Ileibacterium valens TaxID=1862668 RepID=UPI002352B7C3|nr:TIGR01212 family radical SAM protein [Ileibacterium valens]
MNKSSQIKTNPYPYSYDNKRYQTMSWYLKNRYGEKCAKIPLNAGFTCPNRDGKVSFGGCTFCSAKGSGDSILSFEKPLKNQYQDNLDRIHHKWPKAKGIPYFQSFSNTYAPLEKLKEIYTPFLEDPEIFCICIATRADCLEEDFVSWISKYKKDIWIELGLQSSNDQTGKRINRGYSTKDVENALFLLKKYGVFSCIHLINSLPFEDHEMMMESARWCTVFKPDAIKIHMLHMITNTQIAKDYLNGDFKLMDQDEYCTLVCDQLEILPPEMIIERITGDGLQEDLIAPLWTTKKTSVANQVDRILFERNSWQGKYCKVDVAQEIPNNPDPSIQIGFKSKI